MKTIFYLVIIAILLASCAQQPRMQRVDNPANPEPKVVIHDELLNEPPEQPRFIIAQPRAVDTVTQIISESIKIELQRLGYAEATSRSDANVVVWYRYDSVQTGQRHVGQAADVWGDQSVPGAVSDISRIRPAAFTVQLVSLPESQFPDQVITIWQGEWSSSMPGNNLVEFSNGSLAQVFAQYQSEHTQGQIAMFRQARERQVQAAINTYMKMVMYRIQSNWHKPKGKVKGKYCKVKIVQSLVGDIKSHQLLSCDKDRRFRKSIEQAIQQSSPLPMPEHDLFDRRELILIFQG